MKGNDTILSVIGLHIQRGSTVILRAVNWRVNRGQHWVILGANGSGKTSLLSALTGYLMPTAGEISVLGETYGQTDWRELRKQIGLVSSSIRQLMADDEVALKTVASGKYAMISFWGKVSRAEKARARRMLRDVECEYLADRPWQVLSQGERQRVLIGRAGLWDGTIVQRPSASINYLRKQVEACPTSDAWRRLGNTLNRYGLHEQALHAWMQSIADEGELEACWALAEFYYKTSNLVEAIRFGSLLLRRIRGGKEGHSSGDRRRCAEAVLGLVRDSLPLTSDPIALIP